MKKKNEANIASLAMQSSGDFGNWTGQKIELALSFVCVHVPVHASTSVTHEIRSFINGRAFGLPQPSIDSCSRDSVYPECPVVPHQLYRFARTLKVRESLPTVSENLPSGTSPSCFDKIQAANVRIWNSFRYEYFCFLFCVTADCKMYLLQTEWFSVIMFIVFS